MISPFSAAFERFEVAPAVAVVQFDLLGGLAPLPLRPVDVGAKPDRLAAGKVGDDVERKVMTADVALRPRFEQQPLLPQFAGEIAMRVERSAAMARSGLRLVR